MAIGPVRTEQAEKDQPERTLDIECLFRELDANKDGRLDRRELEAALERIHLPVTQSYLNDLFRQYDVDRDGSVDFEEFQRYVRQRESALQRAFRSLDRDGSGKITVNELQESLAGLGVPIDASTAERMVDMIDVDGSSDISFQEFRRFAILLPRSQISNAGIVLDWLDCTSWMDGVEHRLGKIPTREPLQRLLAGGIAGAFSRTGIRIPGATVTAPFERLRTMMMADWSNKTLLGTARKMWASGGFFGLWRGNLVSVIKVVPQSAIQYAVYDTLTKNVLKPSGASGEATLSHAQRLAAGCASGASACVVVFPLETLRTHAAMGKVNLKGAGAYFRIASAITRAKGIPGLYQGFTMGLGSSIAGAGVGFATYEALTVAYRKRVGYAPTPAERGAIAGGAAMVTMTLGMPLEVVMRRMQVQDSPGFPRVYKNTADCIRQMYQREGLSSFWRGTLSSYMKVVPSIAATRLCYEMIIVGLGIGGVRRYRMQEQG